MLAPCLKSLPSIRSLRMKHRHLNMVFNLPLWLTVLPGTSCSSHMSLPPGLCVYWSFCLVFSFLAYFFVCSFVCFRAVLGLLDQKIDQKENTELPHTPRLPSVPYYLYLVLVWYVCYDQYQYIIIKSIFHIRVYSLFCTFCGFWEMHNDMYLLLQYLQKNFPALKSPVLHLFIPSVNS